MDKEAESGLGKVAFSSLGDVEQVIDFLESAVGFGYGTISLTKSQAEMLVKRIKESEITKIGDGRIKIGNQTYKDESSGMVLSIEEFKTWNAIKKHFPV
jgi:hypothetical protein